MEIYYDRIYWLDASPWMTSSVMFSYFLIEDYSCMPKGAMALKSICETTQ